jgi:hypothetical protein
VGALDHLFVSVQDTTKDADHTVTVKIQLQDVKNNVRTADTTQVTLTKVTGNSNFNPTTVTPSSGEAVFSMQLTKVGAHTFTATATGATSVTTAAISITRKLSAFTCLPVGCSHIYHMQCFIMFCSFLAGVPDYLSITQPKTCAKAGVACSLQAQLRDTYGNPVVTDGVAGTLTLVSKPTGATIQGADTTSAGGGFFTFNAIVLDKVGTYNIQVWVLGKSTVTGGFNITRMCLRFCFACFAAFSPLLVCICADLFC